MTINPRFGVLTAFLMLLLTACTSQQIQNAPARDLPPESLLMDTPVPVAAGRKNSDLARWAPELYCALMQSNADKAALRAWRDGRPYQSEALTCE